MLERERDRRKGAVPGRQTAGGSAGIRLAESSFEPSRFSSEHAAGVGLACVNQAVLFLRTAGRLLAGRQLVRQHIHGALDRYVDIAGFERAITVQNAFSARFDHVDIALLDGRQAVDRFQAWFGGKLIGGTWLEREG